MPAQSRRLLLDRPGMARRVGCCLGISSCAGPTLDRGPGGWGPGGWSQRRRRCLPGVDEVGRDDEQDWGVDGLAGVEEGGPALATLAVAVGRPGADRRAGDED